MADDVPENRHVLPNQQSIILHISEWQGIDSGFRTVHRSQPNVLTWGRGKPSSVQIIWGVGLPLALHLSDTDGPGCIVCSMNLYSNWGVISPNFNSAVPWAESKSFFTKHWYMPRSSLVREVILIWVFETNRTREPVRNGWPSFSQTIAVCGVPVTVQTRCASLLRSMIWVAGWIWTSSCADMETWTSIFSLPSEFVAVQ